MCTPEVWGSAGWKFIHCVASSYPQNPTDEQKQNMRGFLLHIGLTLPCVKCRAHFQRQLLEAPDEIFDNKQTLFRWTVDAHNEVNKLNGKATISVVDAHRSLRGTWPSYVTAAIFVSALLLLCVLIARCARR